MKVLLVDDDRSTRYLIGRVLTKRFGCEVTEAGDGRQALEALSHDRFHLAFLDVQMPVMDGLETLRTLRESPEHAALQVVMLTGERDETIIRKILELGVFEYMVKPLNMARLADRLRRMLRTIIAQRDGAPTDPGWFGQALRHIDAPLLIIEGRTPFRRCFAETFGVHRPVIEAESGVAGMRDIVASNPGVVFIGDDLGVLSEPLLLRATIYSVAGAFGTPAIQRTSRWNPLSGDEPGVTLCFQAPSREHEFWLTLRPIRTA